MRRLSLLSLLALFAWLAVSSVAVRADIDTKPDSRRQKRSLEIAARITAVAQPVEVEVARGDTITIRLRGIAAGGGPIEFKLGQKPEYGRILGSKRIAEDVLDVRYRHSGTKTSNFDSFIFGVRQQGMGPFSPGDVKIRVIDTPAKLVAAEDLVQFSTIEIGETETHEVIVSNQGGLTATGAIRATPPWTVAGPETYNLRPGSSLAIPVKFQPDRAGEIEGNLLFDGNTPVSISLAGTGMAPFSVSTRKVQLENAADGSRAGSFSIENVTAHPVAVTVKSDLLAPGQPASFELKFGEAREIRLVTPAGPEMSADVAVSSGKYAANVSVAAGPSLAALEVLPKGELDLGEVAASASLPVLMRIRNSGGAAAEVTAKLSQNLQSRETMHTLEAGSDWTPAIYVKTPGSGSFRESIVFSAPGVAAPIEVVLRGIVASAAKKAPSATPADPAAKAAAIAETLASLPVTSNGEVDLEIAKLFDNPFSDPVANPPLKVKIVRRGRSSARLHWNAPKEKADWRYAIERRDLTLDAEKELHAAWVPVGNLSIEAAGDGVETTIPDLEPDRGYSIRITASAPGQSLRPASPVIAFRTAPGFRLNVDWRYLLIAAAVAMGFFVIRQRWRERAMGF